MYFGDITMNIFSQIGIIMLIGLVAKNGILIVEFANQKQEAGEDKMSAIKDAALQRLRPILMTSASTVLGLIPLAFASGEGCQSAYRHGYGCSRWYGCFHTAYDVYCAGHLQLYFD